MWSDYVVTISGEQHKAAALYIWGEYNPGNNGAYKFVRQYKNVTILRFANNKDVYIQRIFNTATTRFNVKILALNNIEDTELDENGEVVGVFSVGAFIAYDGKIKAEWKDISADENEDCDIDGIRPCDIEVLEKVTGCKVNFEEGNPYEPLFDNNGSSIHFDSLNIGA